MARRNTKLVRVDRDVWGNLEKVLPEMNNPERSRWLFYENIVKRMEKKVNKKGSMIDLLFVIVALTIFGGSILIGAALINNFNDKVQTDSLFPTASKTIVSDQTNQYTSSLNVGFLVLFGFMSIAVIAMAVLVRIPPIFLAFYLFFLVILVIMGAIGTNIFEAIAENSTISPYVGGFGFITSIMAYLPIIVGVFGSILAIVMYKMWSDGQ